MNALPLLSQNLETATQVSIIFMAILTAAFMFVSLVMAAIIGLLVRTLMKKTIFIVDDNVKPMLDSAKETLGSATKTAQNVRGTSSYVSEAAVTPIIRAYGVVAGVRKAAGVLSGITGADSSKPKR